MATRTEAGAGEGRRNNKVLSFGESTSIRRIDDVHGETELISSETISNLRTRTRMSRSEQRTTVPVVLPKELRQSKRSCVIRS